MEEKRKKALFYKKEEILRAWDLINVSSKITLLTHYQPDGDGVAACAALEYILEKMAKSVEIIYPSEPEFGFKRHPKSFLLNTHIQSPDLIIVCDAANYERIYFPREFYSVPLINVDHHVSNVLKGRFNFVNPSSSSACEELFLLFESWNDDFIDKYVSECFLFGIIYDSQVFHTQSTKSRTLKVAASLMDRGADLFQLKTELLSNKNYKIIFLWGQLLSNVKILHAGKVAWAVVTQKDLKDLGLKLSSLIGFNNFLSQICDVDVTLLFYETEEGHTKVSLRSKVTDVDELARKFGGGGHSNSAGFLSEKPLEVVVKEITSKFLS